MSARTQRDRVRRALEYAGSHGITAVDFNLPEVIDGGPPITRVAARIGELRDEGVAITSHGRRQSCVVYRLESAVDRRPASASPPPPQHPEPLVRQPDMLRPARGGGDAGAGEQLSLGALA